MNAKLIVEGKEFEIEILDPELQKLVAPPKKMTGYERVNKSEPYWYEDTVGVESAIEEDDNVDLEFYNTADYYSDKTVAENNFRADKLMRQLRRFAVEHREKELDWSDITMDKYQIYYEKIYSRTLCACAVYYQRNIGGVYFDSRETVQLAIDTFHDELIWYFTEYKDSL